ncbi:hypothetical protein [Hyphomicrobium sp.]|uniref:hypothetical protein n=1 Tax=Hyphomicrobium sp. TaxID=82 RepID=UPI001DDE28BD|nr:hypothetical protein [Hyphomicrobium sp.]MBY0560043.1 hypothetical protein [Hyphomicrobium sp.]
MADATVLYDKALALAPQLKDNFMDLAHHLRDLLETDPAEFQKFYKKSSVNKRKAYYLVEIDRAFRKLGISKNRLHKIGWTKVMILTKHINDSNAQELITMAEQNSAHSLQALLKGQKKPANAHCVLMYFKDSDYNLFYNALIKRGAQQSARGLINKEEALVKLLKDLEKDR